MYSSCKWLGGLLATVALGIGNTAYGTPPKKDIVNTAVEAGSFKTLATALQKAGLVNALKGDGPFTVFAPTDDAFAKLPKKTVDFLLRPENKQTLVGILTYHVVPGHLGSGNLTERSVVKSLNGQQIDLAVNNKKLRVDGATITAADIECTNGVIHVIDRVILPSSDDILATAAKTGKFKTLATAIKTAGLVEALSADGPFTVFAPTDDAFSKLPEGTITELLKPANRSKLTSILKYHVVAGRKFASDVVQAGKLTTLQGSNISINKRNGNVRINDAKLLATDVDASNGVIHIIDSVLLPPAAATKKTSASSVRDMVVKAINRGAPPGPAHQILPRLLAASCFCQ